MRRLSSPAGCGGCSVRGKPGRCLQDSVSTNRGTRVRHQPRPRPTARSRFSSSSGSVSTGSKSRARRPDAPAWEATAAHLRAGPAGVLVEGAFACVRLRDSFRVSLGFPQENRSANSREKVPTPSVRAPPRQSRPASLGQSALPSRGPPCAPGTCSPTALSSQFAPPTWVRPPTTFGGRAAASSHAWIARHQLRAQTRLKLIEHESTPWRCQWMKVRMPTPLGHTSTMASIGASKPALHIARNPLPPFNHSTCRRADGS